MRNSQKDFMTIGDLKKIIDDLERKNLINNSTLVLGSSDSEGNRYHSYCKDAKYTVALRHSLIIYERDTEVKIPKNNIVLFPYSTLHFDYDSLKLIEWKRMILW